MPKSTAELFLVCVLHNIRSLHNVGSIFRTADAAGVERIYLTGITPAPRDRFGVLRPRFAKVALGAEKAVPWEKTNSAARLLKNLQSEGYKILAVEQSPRSVPYWRVKVRNGRIALVFGSEVKGIPPSLLKLAHRIIEIPMRGIKESLNVAVAAGVVLFHMRDCV